MIHPSALIDADAVLADDVSVGPFTIIGPGVEVGAGTVIGPHVVLKGPTRIGRNNRIYQFSSVGEDCQDKKYAGEPTRLEIGDRNVIREFVTIHRGTIQDKGVTSIGNDNLLMAYTHVAHDCVVGNGCIMANAASLAGHVHVNDHAILGGFTLVHQFCKIGKYSFSAMGSVVSRDIPPYVIVGGSPTEPHGVNTVGLERRGFSSDAIREIRRAYKIIYKSNHKLDEAIALLADMATRTPELACMVEFLRNTGRSIVR
ncbi:acyl-ACP--UDP-N-acetylglucosamine O-acyltransferase [Methylogaea oryzae]|uniref:Acyl-[acyl-carrier-protein]--UDP-N-acetylglucosamine O-acyltransferase n=1 Tax=Methylogaea oryzae TaxID=1295382 RepID=A0A8D5AHY1_9GAMM|nr:acyl-ACP--UDP-N-acetylglucosamine O-acyltransferase [Methylogaea oryzae]BBL70751.1 acyl-[acyl-carrier-protein]--UDP-N-acetylglucosam ine O-acyltransferase [Methylogaea oryzae]